MNVMNAMNFGWLQILGCAFFTLLLYLQRIVIVILKCLSYNILILCCTLTLNNRIYPDYNKLCARGG